MKVRAATPIHTKMRKERKKKAKRKALATGELMLRMQLQLKTSQKLLKKSIKMTLETLANLKQLQMQWQKIKSQLMTGATSTNLPAKNQQKKKLKLNKQKLMQTSATSINLPAKSPHKLTRIRSITRLKSHQRQT